MDFNFNELACNNYKDFIDYLKAIGEEKYRNFVSGLTPDIGIIYGVRTPMVRKFAKEISKNPNLEELKIFLLNGKSHEEKLIYTYIIGLTKYKDFETFIADVDNFVPRINNWAVNDSLASAIKKNAKNFEEEYFDYIRKNIKSDNPWRVRFALICLNSTFVEEKHIDEILMFVSGIKTDHYYVNMGIAWLISSCYIKDSEKIKVFLGNNILDKWVQNKSIQKIVESTRVNAEDKVAIKKYRL
ncbi:MAG: DNA alkylation repair protein [Sarcina sp.]